ncbi:hypothetical protein M0802_002651 [Mischocyttarus mexicanus]|nr:hypothetical protein M0802_002651 [Mischocyttarus mexicanus]
MTRGNSELLAEGTTVNIVHRKQQRSLHQQQQQHQHHHHQQHQHQQQSSQQNVRKSVAVMGSRRIFAPSFKLKVLDSYRHDIDCRGNQRATARKYGIHRRQIQKWLQCEDNLRNSCAETNNSNSIVSTSPPSLSSSSPSSLSSLSSSSSSPTSTTTVISKHDVTLSTTSEGVTMPGVTPAVPAPALNLGLARLHGDESAVRPPPPLLPSRTSLTRDSPSSPRYTHSTSEIVLPATTTTTTMTIVGGYGPRDQHQRSRCHPEIENGAMQQVSALNDHERIYYEWNNTEEQRKRDLESTHYDVDNETKIYETLTTCFRPTRRDLPYPPIEVATSTITSSPATTLGSTDSSSMDGNAYCRVLTPSMIKTERASPDSVATWTQSLPLSPHQQQQQQQQVSRGGVNDCYAENNTSVVLFSTCESLYSDKCPESIEKRNILTVLEEDKNEDKKRRRLFCDVKIKKEEIDEEEEEEKEEEKEEEEEESRFVGEEETREEDGVSFFIDSHPARQTTFPIDSRSPDDDQEGTYSEPGSISAVSSSGSCSDSEMDSLVDCCPSNEIRASSNDLSRRRSFSLRFKLDVLDAFHRDIGVAGNQRATARKFGINRRQVQKWLGQESELRGEIALRGNARQRLGPSQDQTITSVDFPVDLRTTTNYSVSPTAEEESVDVEYVERSPPPLSHHFQNQRFYCCEWESGAQYLPNYRPTDLSPEPMLESPRIFGYSCCMDPVSNSSCYPELRSPRGSSYADSVTGPSSRCYLSPQEYNETSVEESPTKRRRCTAALSCCYEEFISSPKRPRLDTDEKAPPQEVPLCLVKEKRFQDFFSSVVEQPVTGIIQTSPVSQAPPLQQQPPPNNSKDAILFKPYLDNPISKPNKENGVNRDPLSPLGPQIHLNHENNNCQSICNLNEDRASGHGYAIELNLKVPLSWKNQNGGTLHPDFQPIRSAFVRYPTSSLHYI